MAWTGKGTHLLELALKLLQFSVYRVAVLIKGPILYNKPVYFPQRKAEHGHSVLPPLLGAQERGNLQFYGILAAHLPR